MALLLTLGAHVQRGLIIVPCVCVCPGRSSATHVTKRQTRHTHGLSILLAPELIWRFSYNGFVSKIVPYLRPAIFIRETGSFSAFLPYTTLVISRVR